VIRKLRNAYKKSINKYLSCTKAKAISKYANVISSMIQRPLFQKLL